MPLITLFDEWSPSSRVVLDEELKALRLDGTMTDVQRRALDRFNDLIELRSLYTSDDLKGKRALRQLFCYNKNKMSVAGTFDANTVVLDSLQDITESAILVARLLRKTFEASTSDDAFLCARAQALLASIFNVPFNVTEYSAKIERLSDHMQRDGGLTFLILNLVSIREWVPARRLAQRLLTSHFEVEEDLRSALYWLTELTWFVEENTEPLTEYDSTIRYLYHLCFTNPERAGFLEIDSQFYSQFHTINELAREAFLFKESLIEKFLGIWAEHDGFFDSVFQNILQTMTGHKSKIYNEVGTWEKLWKREQEEFSKDYLYVVEGNLSYASREFEDAKNYYEKALKSNSSLRSALLNSVFAYAQTGSQEQHSWAIERILENSDLKTSALYVAGNSYLLLGQDTKSEAYYSELQKIPGWELKTHFYRSTFCFENGLYEKALLFARLAHQASPTDTSILYHLSLCFSAVGEKERALETVKTVSDGPQWMDYYRFTLQRDAGRHDEASATLLNLPTEYFQDPDELEAALDFARTQKDLSLLRHLRKR